MRLYEALPNRPSLKNMPIEMLIVFALSTNLTNVRTQTENVRDTLAIRKERIKKYISPRPLHVNIILVIVTRFFPKRQRVVVLNQTSVGRPSACSGVQRVCSNRPRTFRPPGDCPTRFVGSSCLHLRQWHRKWFHPRKRRSRMNKR